jgi:hypothetical protein
MRSNALLKFNERLSVFNDIFREGNQISLHFLLHHKVAIEIGIEFNWMSKKWICLFRICCWVWREVNFLISNQSLEIFWMLFPMWIFELTHVRKNQILFSKMLHKPRNRHIYTQIYCSIIISIHEASHGSTQILALNEQFVNCYIHKAKVHNITHSTQRWWGLKVTNRKRVREDGKKFKTHDNNNMKIDANHRRCLLILLFFIFGKFIHVDCIINFFISSFLSKLSYGTFWIFFSNWIMILLKIRSVFKFRNWNYGFRTVVRNFSSPSTDDAPNNLT